MPKGVYQSEIRGRYERTPEHRAAKSAQALRHGYSHTPTYGSWYAMKQRCTNPNNRMYARYGGRGIRVCDRWLHSFENFLADMGERPDGATLDRIDTNGNYKPGNCRWATQSEQASNRNPRKLKDRGIAGNVRAELERDPDRSNAEIAALVGCTRANVRKIRALAGLPAAPRHVPTGRGKKCEPGCTCGRHGNSGNFGGSGHPCEPGCTCGRHNRITTE